jgi:integrase
MTQIRNRRAGVEDRWTKTLRRRLPDGTTTTETVPSAVNGKGLRWRARYVDEDGREHAKGFRTKADATAWLNGIISAQETGSYVDPSHGKVTFSSFYAEWSKRQVWVSGTKHSVDLAANSVTFGTVAFADLRASHFEAWVKRMQDNKLEPTTIRTRFNNVHNVIRAAVRDRLLARDIAERVKLPRTRKSSAAMTIPAAEQVGAAIRACENIEPWYAGFIAVCAFAGLRRGEALALKVSDIDFMRKELHVQRQAQRAEGGQLEIRGPKYGSERTIFIPEGLVTILSEHIRLYRGGDDPDRWLFPGSRDETQPAHESTIARWWRLTAKDVGITHRLHDLRHFYASGLIAAGCDVVTVQRALGHSSPSVTLDTYSHLWPDANDRTRTAAAGLIEQALKPTADALRTEG